MTDAPRSPLFNDNRIKLGAMAFNCSHGSTVTTADGAWQMTWADNRKLARMADAAGFEALLPVGRWKGYGGETNFNNRTFESLTWAAGIAAETSHATVFSTVHAPLVHPVAAAKDGRDGGPYFGRPFRAQPRRRLVQERVRHVRPQDAAA